MTSTGNRPETSVMKSVTVKITVLSSTDTSSGAVSELYWNRCPSGRVPAQLADAPSGIWYSTEWLYRTQRIFLERWSNCLTWTTVGIRFSVKDSSTSWYIFISVMAHSLLPHPHDPNPPDPAQQNQLPLLFLRAWFLLASPAPLIPQ